MELQELIENLQGFIERGTNPKTMVTLVDGSSFNPITNSDIEAIGFSSEDGSISGEIICLNCDCLSEESEDYEEEMDVEDRDEFEMER